MSNNNNNNEEFFNRSFDSLETLETELRKHAHSKGFDIVKGGSIKNKEVSRFVSCYFTCVHGGQYKPHRVNKEGQMSDEESSMQELNAPSDQSSNKKGKARHPRKTKKLGCSFCVYATCGKKETQWTFNTKSNKHNLKHNHNPVTNVSIYPAIRKQDLDVEKLKEYSESGVEPRQALQLVRNENPQSSVIIKDIYNTNNKFNKEAAKNGTNFDAIENHLKKKHYEVRYLAIIKQIDQLLYNPSLQEFNQARQTYFGLVNELSNAKEMKTHLSSILKYKEHWGGPWVTQHPSLGCTLTQRAEKFHHCIKEYLNAPSTVFELVDRIVTYDQTLREDAARQLDQELMHRQLFKDLQKKNVDEDMTCALQPLDGSICHFAIWMIRKEMYRARDLFKEGETGVSIGTKCIKCYRPFTWFLPCRHQLLTNVGEISFIALDPSVIHKRWWLSNKNQSDSSNECILMPLSNDVSTRFLKTMWKIKERYCQLESPQQKLDLLSELDSTVEQYAPVNHKDITIPRISNPKGRPAKKTENLNTPQTPKKQEPFNKNNEQVEPLIIPKKRVKSSQLEARNKRYRKEEEAKKKILPSSDDIPAKAIRKMIQIIGDGYCGFRAIAYNVYKDQDRHMEVRKQMLDFMMDPKYSEKCREYIFKKDDVAINSAIKTLNYGTNTPAAALCPQEYWFNGDTMIQLAADTFNHPIAMFASICLFTHQSILCFPLFNIPNEEDIKKPYVLHYVADSHWQTLELGLANLVVWPPINWRENHEKLWIQQAFVSNHSSYKRYFKYLHIRKPPAPVVIEIDKENALEELERMTVCKFCENLLPETRSDTFNDLYLDALQAEEEFGDMVATAAQGIFCAEHTREKETEETIKEGVKMGYPSVQVVNDLLAKVKDRIEVMKDYLDDLVYEKAKPKKTEKLLDVECLGYYGTRLKIVIKKCLYLVYFAKDSEFVRVAQKEKLTFLDPFKLTEQEVEIKRFSQTLGKKIDAFLIGTVATRLVELDIKSNILAPPDSIDISHSSSLQKYAIRMLAKTRGYGLAVDRYSKFPIGLGLLADELSADDMSEHESDGDA
ncbi:hypothetical protein BDA99DRAFT_543953 [Phascolomyces articulosus]|uniref:OTU domain-containing protein n=1 Tax=Phascolomyces articulosus TaxID=60185 RepID=A0AAD5JXW7_9FUNG|nr:hypothetical protein BDA99DRAFT_543953 [Phascolomyces articulosus]